jgi:hypothetical protein
VAEQAAAAKGSDAYAKGRILSFAKDSLGAAGAIAKTFMSAPGADANYKDAFQRTDANANAMYSSETDPYGGGYQYDSGANLFGVDIPVVEVPPMTIEQFYN